MPTPIQPPKYDPIFQSPRLCNYCHCQIMPGDVLVVCPGCKSVYHDQCWIGNNNRCATLGCSVQEPVRESPKTNPIYSSYPLPPYDPQPIQQVKDYSETSSPTAEYHPASKTLSTRAIVVIVIILILLCCCCCIISLFIYNTSQSSSYHFQPFFLAIVTTWLPFHSYGMILT